MDWMTPNVGEPTVVPGVWNCAWLKRLKISARNWRRGVNFFDTDRSTFHRPGPKSVVRAALPSTPAGGATKQLVSNHRAIVGSDNFPSQTRSGLLPNHVPDWLVDMLIPSGYPLLALKIVLTCHPPMIACGTPLKSAR